AMGTVRIVVATAKAAVGPRRSGGDDRGKEAALRKELDEAEREVEEAAHDIQDALQPHPSFSAWS
ncbi:MAG TPA: hypothetical protein VN436_08065, partial [Holophaga sp.]|nr:hypothetical protein [Holophaga sp.]